MSDKSFGDHMSRSIVKNPLLSTAVTGLSIEDLTHNAVLLPVSRSQELFGRQETQNTIAPEVTPNPAGDSFTPVHPQNANKKDKDDFNVNEYFERLQGTRYVSAPINSHLIEDTSATLEDKEENLEEINLNEPVTTDDVQQSITADIAQNFSQLPTVLPQVANAVFSSFSNMLNMKSREHTPDERTKEQIVQTQAQGVPLMGVCEREVAPPPREPPVTGSGNYRLVSKKKYAQIPGLCSGESSQMPSYTPPTFNQPIFTPQQEVKYATNVESNVPIDVGQSNVDSNVYNYIPQNIPTETSSKPPNIFEATKEDSNFVTTSQYTQNFSPQGAIIPPPPMFSNLAKKDSPPNAGKAILPPSVARRIGSNKPTISNQAPAFASIGNIFVPAPVTADTETSAAAQSFVPAQANPLATSFPSSYASQSGISSTPPNNAVSSVSPNISLGMPSTAQFAPDTTSQLASSMPRNVAPSAEKPLFNTEITGSVAPPLANVFAPPASSSFVKVPSTTSQAVSASILTPPQTFILADQSQPSAPPTMFIPSTQAQSAQKISSPANVASVSMIPTSATSVQPHIFNPYSQEQPIPGLKSEDSVQIASTQPPVAPQMISHHNKHESILKTGILDVIPVAAPPKIPEPPKATGQANFRMTKKRPQYYSGPIEGVGAISNNVKPTLAPVATPAFQGAVFTPEANTSCQPAVFTPENISSSQGAMITPTATESPNQSSMFTPLDINVGAPNNQYAFDMNKPGDNSSFTQCDLNKAPENVYTAFDVSHPVTNTYESYDPPKPESTFGIIGSLKSKLSSLDINKLQNSVTTFFDPAYNAPRTEAAKENVPTYGQNQGIEIFVANPEVPAQPYNYDAHQASFTYGQGAIPNATDYYNQQVHNVYSTNSYYSQPSYGTQSYSHTELQSQQAYSQNTNVQYNPNPMADPSSQITSVPTYQTNISYVQDNVGKNTDDPGFVATQKPLEPEDAVSVDSTKVDYPTVFQDQLGSDAGQIIKATNNENIEEAMKNLQIQNIINADLEAVILTEEQDATSSTNIMQHDLLEPLHNIKSDFVDDDSESIVEKAFLDVVHKKNEINYFDMLGNPEKEFEDLKQKEKSQLDNMFSAPLHDLSSMIADRSREISDGVSELGDDASWNTNEEDVDNQSIAERLLTLGDSSDDSQHLSESGQGVDLNICETCREVNHEPEHKDADFTTQLIENITAPIQLLNPVEVPLTETHSTVPEDFDPLNQCAEISLIADETVETLQIQSATELLDENKNPNVETSYGWRTEAPLPPGQDLLDHDYTFKTNPDAIGFYGNKNHTFDNISKNASDEIKAEFKISHVQPPAVLQRQMSMPTAPPAEDFDDTKSDETGALDVQSIEQDASKDFPVFEEYVIEPSETDDEKVEFRDKTDMNKDTFTNRVDKFKKLEGNEDAAEQKDVESSNIIMPSYFDTGNYAAETHFKNSQSSPTISRIPPGFEDHYELKPKVLDKKYEVIKVPETSTQTNLTTTVSDACTKTENVTSTVFSSMMPIQEPAPEAKLPDFASVYGAKIDLKDTSIYVTEKTIEPPAKKKPITPKEIIEEKVKGNKLVSLPDPINFFALSTQKSDDTERKTDTESVNRLASYFATPAKTDSTKPFFELSQGQNHYRQNKDDKMEGHKSFFELSESQDHYKENIANIPTDKFIANLSLMNDLASCQNIDPNKEQIVRTVNYFTVEYDNSNLNFSKDVIANFNKGEPSVDLKQPDLNVKKNIETDETIINDENLTEIISRCKYCCDNYKIVTERDLDSIGTVKFRQAMDNSSKASEGGVMETKREEERTVGVSEDDVADERDSSEGVAMMAENRSSNEYEPVKHHWFYRVDTEDKSTWRGFSVSDSRAIENAFLSPELNEGTLVPTDGGRYDVNVVGRLRISVYWSDKPTNVRRCSWFYKGTTDARYVPYTEAVAEKLEVEYRHGVTTGEWHRRLVLPNGELVVMHGPAVMVHFLQAGADAYGAPDLFSFGKRVYRNPPKFKVCHDLPPKIDHLLFLVHGAGEWRHQKDKIQSTMRPRVVRRGIDDSEIEDTEPSSIDHLLLMCHGVGSACDMRFRAVEEVVNDFRATSLQLLQSHYRNSYDNGIVGRVEVLPISWHAPLHTGPDGVDRRLARVTLASIPRLRTFTNDTVLDVLLYTSPHYCQMILDTVCGELNRIYTLFIKRNPDFKGQVSLGGHSLGSVILYDLLCNQPISVNPSTPRSEKTYLTGSTANNPSFQYPKLCFEPLALYALGSPIAIFECIRGVESLGSEFRLPTCKNFFNIFHPYDPIAYRIEPLVNPQLQNVKPSLIPHHKGRKRMHLELKDTMARVGADLKQKLMESIRSTWSSMWSSAPPAEHQLEKVVEEEIEKEQQLEAESSKEEPIQADITPGEMLGRLNAGRRVDHVLQEAPFEMINEYLFAMSSHVCYWESEDVMLLILREIYDSMDVRPDVTVPQQSMSVQRVSVLRDGEKVVVNPTDASTSRVS